jgi:hypothetical protein
VGGGGGGVSPVTGTSDSTGVRTGLTVGISLRLSRQLGG